MFGIVQGRRRDSIDFASFNLPDSVFQDMKRRRVICSRRHEFGPMECYWTISDTGRVILAGCQS